MTDKKKLSASAKWVREVRGPLTQREFASRLGVHEISVSNWERGRYKDLDWHSVQLIRRTFPHAPPPPGILPPALAQRVAGVPRTLEAAEVAGIIDQQPDSVRAYMRDAIYRILTAHAPNPPPSSAGVGKGKPRAH
jgi:DNA-binding XRE family transcriptional regulator